MYHTILLPVDGSEGARSAVRRALALAARDGAAVHALHVVDTRRYGEPARSSTELTVDDLEDAGNELLTEIRETAAMRGIDVTVRCCHGRPADEILAHAAAVGADLVVMGTTGESGRCPGHVTEHVLHSAESEVLAV